MQTTTCVACGKPARVWTGHLMHFARTLGAGWCSEKCYSSVPSRRNGCFGEWRPSMAVTHRGKLATKTGCSCGPTCAVWRLDNPGSAYPA